MRVNTVAPPNAKLFIVGEAPGPFEDATGKPFHPEAPAGKMLDKLLFNAGISRYEVILGNVCKERPPGNKIAYFFKDYKNKIPKPELERWLNELQKEILLYKPNVILGVGVTALWALTGETKIEPNRGYMLTNKLVPGIKTLCTYHPQHINYNIQQGFTAVMDFRKAVRESRTPIARDDKRSLNAYPSKKEFTQYVEYLLNVHQGPISLDIETTTSGHLDILGLAASPFMASSFTFVSSGKAKYSAGDEFKLWLLLGKLFKEKSIIMHNGLFDMASMWYHLGVLAERYNKDTMIAAHCCWPENPRSLGYLSSICLNVPKWKHTAADNAAMYNCEDAANTYGVWEFLAHEMDRGDHWDTFNFEMSQVWPASMMQLQGVKVNREVQKSLIEKTNKEIKVLEAVIHTAVGKPFNINSHQQLKEILYNHMRLPEQYKRRKSRTEIRKVTSDADALRNLYRITQNSILEQILNYKELVTRLRFLDIELSSEDRVHTSYNVTGATMSREQKGKVVDDEEQYRSFGRWSSSKSIILPFGSGNLQNIPKQARKIYTAPSGWKWVQADYKQAEAVVVSYCTGDQPMVRLFQESFGLTKEECDARGFDIHRLTAAIMFQQPLGKITDEQRNIGKTLRHAISYSAGPGVLAGRLGIGMTDAKKLIAAYHNRNPQLRIWYAKIQKELSRTRTLTNLLGRKHKFQAPWGDKLFRSAYSYIPQSTVGDLLNKALVRLYNTYGEEINISLQLHDAIYCLVPEDLIDWTCTCMKQCMLIPLRVNEQEFYIDIDFSIGDSWGEQEYYTPNFTQDLRITTYGRQPGEEKTLQELA